MKKVALCANWPNSYIISLLFEFFTKRQQITVVEIVEKNVDTEISK